jgi:hypothetical protein
MIPSRFSVLPSVAAVFAGLLISGAVAQQVPDGPVKVVQLTGLNGVKDNAKGTLAVESGRLHFVHGKETSDVSAALIEDVVTGADTQRAVGGTIGTLSMAAPYGGGRFLSLFRTKIDTLIVQYRDADGGLHGAIFTMRFGTAEGIKKELIAQGAHTTIAADPGVAAATSGDAHSKEPRQ